MHLLHLADNDVLAMSPLREGSNRLGRDHVMDVFLLDPRVSRRHALIRVEFDGVAVLVDLGSAGGTFVNGRRLHGSVQLRHGDRIRLGGSVMEFVDEVSSITSREEFLPFSRNT